MSTRTTSHATRQSTRRGKTLTYQNPVFPGYFADPFVWRVGRTYYAVGTGVVESPGNVAPSAPRVFPLLQSDDFVTWRLIGAALVPPEGSRDVHFWAPEVAEHEGRFYLYYSSGTSDEDHRLYVAISDRPEGPYHQAAGPLVDPKVRPFAIDAHPFRDEDGQWYLFYARNFLDTENGQRAGTALVVDRLFDMTRLAGEEKVVLRAQHDWQLFKAQRPMYGRIFDWHTLEGPCVVKRDGQYYCFYSGSCWETVNYGVDYCVADQVMGPYSTKGSDCGARVLKTVPGHVRGPGHNSIVLGPDDQTQFIAYHGWDEQLRARKLCLDALTWTPDGPRCNGPTWTPQTIQVSSAGR